MKAKYFFDFAVLFSAVIFTFSLAEAKAEYLSPLQVALGTSAISCSACHAGGPSAGNAVLPMATTWRTGAHLALSDSDGDGYNNLEEVNGAATNFNDPAVSPFTLAIGGVKLANVYVIGDNAAIEKSIAGIPNLVITADSQVLGNLAVNVSADPTLTAPITLVYKAGGAAATSTVYAISASANLPFAATDWALNTDGSVQIKQWPAGAAAGTHDIAVVRKIPVVPAPGPARGGEEEACVTSFSTTPILMFFMLLLLTVAVKRNKQNV